MKLALGEHHVPPKLRFHDLLEQIWDAVSKMSPMTPLSNSIAAAKYL